MVDRLKDALKRSWSFWMFFSVYVVTFLSFNSFTNIGGVYSFFVSVAAQVAVFGALALLGIARMVNDEPEFQDVSYSQERTVEV